jgi:trans-aconitate methyltransferase
VTARQMSAAASPWNGSAAAYGVETERISFYRVTNRELVAAARLEPGMVVVDLACGTGLTTRAILAALGEACTVYAVDSAQEMLRQARQALPNRGVRFVQASAEAFARSIPVPVDRVLCNAAFWHFPNPDAALGQIRTVLESSGRFLFNIPDQEFDFGDGRRSEMARVVATCLQHPQSTAAPRYSCEAIQVLAAGSGFWITDYQVVQVQLRPEDLVRFYSIPHVGARRFPDRTPEERRRLFAEAFGRLAPDEPVPYRWAQFALVPAPR